MPHTFAADDQLILTNLKKVFWPKEGYTKGDLLNYYREVAPVLLPYLVNRPQVLHRHVDGYAGKEFFQRVSRQCPSWIEVVQLSLDRGKVRDYHLCQNWPTLLWMANFGCVELIPWSSRVGSLDRPYYLVIDFDPEGVPFVRVVEAAQAVHRMLEKACVESYCKTSGKRGLHIYVPLGRRYMHEQAKMLAELVTRLVHRQLPEITSLDPRPNRRQGRIYLDRTRNARGQAVAAPYSVRPYPGATVSTPLKWSEIKRGLEPGKFTIRTVLRRIEKVGDLWQKVLGPGIDLRECLQRLEKAIT